MKNILKTAMVGAIASASFAIAPAAHAAHEIDYDFDADGSFSAEFGNEEPTSPSFEDVFTPFTIDRLGLLTGAIIETSAGLSFSLAQINDLGDNMVVLDFLPVQNGPFGVSSFSIRQTALGPGTYQLVVGGTANASAAANNSYAGTLNFAPVPEPGTWAMLLLGFGIIGFGMRRRNSTAGQQRMRVSYT